MRREKDRETERRGKETIRRIENENMTVIYLLDCGGVMNKHTRLLYIRAGSGWQYSI